MWVIRVTYGHPKFIGSLYLMASCKWWREREQQDEFSVHRPAPVGWSQIQISRPDLGIWKLGAKHFPQRDSWQSKKHHPFGTPLIWRGFSQWHHPIIQVLNVYPSVVYVATVVSFWRRRGVLDLSHVGPKACIPLCCWPNTLVKLQEQKSVIGDLFNHRSLLHCRLPLHAHIWREEVMT